MNVQSVAIGSNTIAITKGAMNTLSEDEIKGIFAHEFAHIEVHFTQILAGLQTSILFVTLALYLYRVIANIFKNLSLAEGRKITYVTIIFYIFKFFVDAFMFIPIFIFKYLFSLGRRHNEYYADAFAVHIGYGENLRDALKLFYQIEMSEKLTLIESIMSTHPPTVERISNIESLLDS